MDFEDVKKKAKDIVTEVEENAHVEFFQELFIDGLEREKGLYDAGQAYVDMMLGEGVNVDANRYMSDIDMLHQRLLKVHLVKKIADNFQFSPEEYSKVLDAEIALIYGHRPLPRNLSPSVVGEIQRVRFNEGESK